MVTRERAIIYVRSGIGMGLILLGGRVLAGRAGRDMVARAVTAEIDREQNLAALAAAFGIQR